jgi:uncharacterized protein with PQ loop repeat
MSTRFWRWWDDGVVSVSTVVVIGWAATVFGTILGLPQVVRLIRTRRIDGLSLTAWQAILTVNIGWTAHGISIGQLPRFSPAP